MIVHGIILMIKIQPHVTYLEDEDSTSSDMFFHLLCFVLILMFLSNFLLLHFVYHTYFISYLADIMFCHI